MNGKLSQNYPFYPLSGALIVCKENYPCFPFLFVALHPSLSFIGSADPFKEQQEDGTAGDKDSLIHIRIQQRNGRKTLTTVQGLSSDYDLKKIVKVCKKVKYRVMGTILYVQLI